MIKNFLRGFFGPSAALIVAPFVSAQEPVLLFQVGDTFGTQASVSQIRDVAVLADGGWMATAVMGGGGLSGFPNALIVDGAVLLRAGQPVYGDPTRRAFIPRSYARNNMGDELVSVALDTTFSGGDVFSSLWLNGQLVLEEEDLVQIDGLPQIQEIEAIFEVYWTGFGRDFYGMMETISPTGQRTYSVAVIRFNSTGIESIERLVGQGDSLPGQSSPSGIGPQDREVAAAQVVDSTGSALYFGRSGQPGGGPDGIYLDDQLLALEGGLSPIAGRTWGRLEVPVARNAQGGYAYSGRLTGSAADDEVLVANGVPLVQEGDALSGIAPFAVTRISPGLGIDDSGRVLWSGSWSNFAPNRGAGIFLGDELLVESGVTTVGGVPLVAPSAATGNMTVRGSKGVFIAQFLNGARGVFMLDLGVGSSYCGPAVANSTGMSATMESSGFASAAKNDLTLVARHLPPNQFGIFMASLQSDFNPGAGGTSNGDLCLGGTIGRYVGPGQVFQASRAGVVALDIDLQSIPQGSVLASAAPGETRYFQAWFRDLGGLGSNFTDGVAIEFD